MSKLVLKVLILLFLVSGSVLAQDQAGVPGSRRTSSDNVSAILNESLNSSKVSPLSNVTPVSKDNDQQIMSMMLDQYSSGRKYFQPQKQITQPDIKSRLVSSFRENIHFAGFWNHYAIINFTPAMNIKPFDFMTIDANQNLSCYIPIGGIKEHFKTILIHGAAILAIDNSVKLMEVSNSMVRSIAGFVLKNVITTILKAYIDKPSSKKIYSYNSYFYSMSIKF